MASVIVSTFTRGGSSLTMQMLHAAGVDCEGRWPAFEPRSTSLAADLAQHGKHNKAVKIIDPTQRGAPPAGISKRAIWLDRDETDRAKSSIAFLGLMPPTRHAIRTMAGSYRRDRGKAFKWLKGAGVDDILIIDFQALIETPFQSAVAICEFLSISSYKAKIMADQALKRPGRFTGKNYEAQLLGFV